MGTWEFYTLLEKTGNHPQKFIGTVTGGFLFATFAWTRISTVNSQILLTNVAVVFIIFIVELFSNSSNPFANIAFTILGLVYVALPFSLLNFITSFTNSYSYQLLFGFFFILWSNDTGAYLAGSAFGKHKLFLRISPGKTWEGAIGGAIAAYAIAYIISRWYNDITLFDWMVITTILIVIGTFGDLVESLLKRSIDVKDSGNILPGHGGILDRFDSLMLATPFVFIYLFCLKT